MLLARILVVGEVTQSGIVESAVLVLEADSPVLMAIVLVFEGVDRGAVRAFDGHLDAVAEFVVLVGESGVDSLAVDNLLDEESTVIVSVFGDADRLLTTSIVDSFLAGERGGVLVCAERL